MDQIFQRLNHKQQLQQNHIHLKIQQIYFQLSKAHRHQLQLRIIQYKQV